MSEIRISESIKHPVDDMMRSIILPLSVVERGLHIQSVKCERSGLLDHRSVPFEFLRKLLKCLRDSEPPLLRSFGETVALRSPSKVQECGEVTHTLVTSAQYAAVSAVSVKSHGAYAAITQ